MFQLSMNDALYVSKMTREDPAAYTNIPPRKFFVYQNRSMGEGEQRLTKYSELTSSGAPGA